MIGKELTVCADCEINTITAAIAVADSGDVIIVSEGLYKEGNIVIDKPLHLLGKNYPKVDGEEKDEIFTIIADHVTIEGFQIQNVGVSYLKDQAGIRVKRKRHFEILNNKLVNTFFGIYLEYAKYGLVKGNEITGDAKQEMSSGNAVHLWYCKHIQVEENRCIKHRDGIYFEFADSCEVKNNHSEGNIRYGLHFMFSNYDEYYNNVFKNNGAGVAVMFSKWIVMHHNLFELNWGNSAYGLLLKEIYDAEIYNNVYRENTIGIYIEGSSRINYINNNYEGNGWAIKLSGGCLDNVFSGNNFISNTFDFATESNFLDNEISSNYWSSYAGYDLDRDGVGDVPYRPVKLFTYIVNKSPESIVLLRSFFVDIINFSEKVSPVFTPENIFDPEPKMKEIQW